MNGEEKSSILIVDDEEVNLDVLTQILKTQYTIYLAKSGQSALSRAKKNKPDLILLDIIMPDMSGFEVLAELKESDLTRKIPVIFITGLTSAADEEKGFFLGAVDYITKPFHSSIVKARVKTHLQIVNQIRTIEQLGMLDALTNIPNRRSFDNRINEEWKRAIQKKTPLSMLMIDVDKFKTYNDAYGHPQGDVLLQTITKVFVSTLTRPTDSVFRWGGEEFAVLLPNTDLPEALNIAENIRANIESTMIPIAGSGSLTSVTISIGVSSIVPAVENQLADFVSDADKALYTAKQTGRNRVCS